MYVIQVLIWLQDIGLSMYTNECHVWGKSGQYILDCSQREIEKQLKISNVLHRKKLKLALDGESDSAKTSYYVVIYVYVYHVVHVVLCI